MKKLSKIDINKIYKVEWTDAASVNIDWTSKEDYSPPKEIHEITDIVTVGWIIYVSDTMIYVSQNMSDRDISHVMAIPYGMINNVTEIA